MLTYQNFWVPILMFNLPQPEFSLRWRAGRAMLGSDQWVGLDCFGLGSSSTWLSFSSRTQPIISKFQPSEQAGSVGFGSSHNQVAEPNFLASTKETIIFKTWHQSMPTLTTGHPLRVVLELHGSAPQAHAKTSLLRVRWRYGTPQH